jgi:dipeptidyl aminopeptidase/acylaminoacyl peptidase
MPAYRNTALVAVAVLAAAAVLAPVSSVRAQSGATLNLGRASLANSAAFTVTNTVAPKGGSKVSQVYKVEVKGSKARLDYSDPAIGAVTYLANEKGVFFVIPANKTAVKQTFQGGVEGALRVAFAQANEQLKTAKKVGTATVSGQPTDVYKDAKTGALIYVGKKPGFRLPVKTVLTNEGGTRTLTVTGIVLNPKLSDARFALPAGTQLIDNGSGAPAAPVPGVLPGGGGGR